MLPETVTNEENIEGLRDGIAKRGLCAVVKDEIAQLDLDCMQLSYMRYKDAVLRMQNIIACIEIATGSTTESSPNRCVCCGEIIPEGRQVCPDCSAK